MNQGEKLEEGEQKAPTRIKRKKFQPIPRINTPVELPIVAPEIFQPKPVEVEREQPLRVQ